MNHAYLRSPETAVVFTQALTGLGHLRVTHALYQGLPPGVHAHLLNSQEESVNVMHRLMSIHPTLRRITEFAQSGILEDIYTPVLRRYFRTHADLLRKQLKTILEERLTQPKTLLVVATHAFQGHQIAAIKDDFAREMGIRVLLVVVVTDDSPQYAWAVEGADLIVVPSMLTKQKLEEYHRKSKLKHTLYIVDSYPISPSFGSKLSSIQYSRRIGSVDPRGLTPIRVSVPVSGAAVHLEYLEHLIQKLDTTTRRFEYTIISLQSPYTMKFLNTMIGRKHVSLLVSSSHRDIVQKYDDYLSSGLSSIEITKPSEQAFKALCEPTMKGGVILLFTDPVGRQEYDNLRFLRRNGLIPTLEENRSLWRLAMAGRKISNKLFESANTWRGLMLPNRSSMGVRFIEWCLEERVFRRMMTCRLPEQTAELSSAGVETFWSQMNNLLKPHYV